MKEGRSTYRNWHFICSSGHISKIMAWNYDESKPCLTCSQPAYRLSHWSDTERQPADRPMYFINGKGEVLFPGHKDDKPPKGFEVRHINSIKDRDNFYKQMDARLRAEHDQYASIEQAHFEYAQEQNRRDLRAAMESMTLQERDLAMAAIEQGNNTQMFFHKNYQPGFHVEALEYDMSNRKPYNDTETNWRDRY